MLRKLRSFNTVCKGQELMVSLNSGYDLARGSGKNYMHSIYIREKPTDFAYDVFLNSKKIGRIYSFLEKNKDEFLNRTERMRNCKHITLYEILIRLNGLCRNGDDYHTICICSPLSNINDMTLGVITLESKNIESLYMFLKKNKRYFDK